MLKIHFLFLFAAVSLRNLHAVTNQEKDVFRKYFMSAVTECIKEMGLDEGAIMEWKKDPCLTACVLEKEGTLEDGVINKEAIIRIAKKLLTDKDAIEEMETITQECATEANNSDIGDDDDTCQRASIFIGCMVEKRAEDA